MKKEDILTKLKTKYPTKTQNLLEQVTADVFYSGEPETVLGSELVLDKLFKRWEHKKAIEGKNTVESNAYCPLCKMATQPIKLDNDRSAKWCSRHFVVFPIKAGE